MRTSFDGAPETSEQNPPSSSITSHSSQRSEGTFWPRHIGPNDEDISRMCRELGVKNLHELMAKVVPPTIFNSGPTAFSSHQPLTERQALDQLLSYFKDQPLHHHMIGMGYYPAETPPALQRYLFENPGWYSPYTPYQSEISQGRLELLFHFQTLCCELTALPLANASLLDEGSAAGEAMSLSLSAARLRPGDPRRYFAAHHIHPQVLSVLRSRAQGLGVELVISSVEDFLSAPTPVFGGVVSYPDTFGRVWDPRPFTAELHRQGAISAAASELLALTQITPPGELGFDIAFGSSQRLGIPLGFGGPHAAFFTTTMDHKRRLPGRVVGRSKDRHGRTAYRLALQTREQHIRRERATSNICTAQALLASMAAGYALYHGPGGLKAIARNIHIKAKALYQLLEQHGCDVSATKPHELWDTVLLRTHDSDQRKIFMDHLLHRHITAREVDSASLVQDRGKSHGIADPTRTYVALTCSETTTTEHLRNVLEAWSLFVSSEKIIEEITSVSDSLSGSAKSSTESSSPEQRNRSFMGRPGTFLTQEVFSKFPSELAFMRYLKELENKDYSLVHGMIPLGSCTMKLNSAAELMPLSIAEISHHHPAQPEQLSVGWHTMLKELEGMLAQVTAMDAVSLQPNSGAQGEWAGLMTIQSYFRSRGEGEQRKVCLIPASAHGTNPASCVMAGLEVVVVGSDSHGNVNLDELKEKAQLHSDRLAALMITYPSTHGVFEPHIKEVCEVIHHHGGQVYMDGANLNAQLGACLAGDFGVDVCHINLHKTFCIPHGGGGPGAGPIAVRRHLAKFLPAPPLSSRNGDYSVCATAYGSPLILTISWMYMKMMGEEGLRRATGVSVLSANYVAHKLGPYYPVLYRGTEGLVAHECLFDFRNITRNTTITVEDVAKRLMDYGFHAPTISFPIPGTMMIEPTESETPEEIERFIRAMISIRHEISAIENGEIEASKSVLRGAPHPWITLLEEPWPYAYSKEQATRPDRDLPPGRKFWPSVSRVDNAGGDRQLICACPPMEIYGEGYTRASEQSADL